MIKEYTFSEILRQTWNNTYGTREQREKLIGKYLCQVFKNNEYVKILIGDSYKEVVELEKQFLKEVEQYEK